MITVGQTKPKPFGWRAVSASGILVGPSGRYQRLVEVSSLNFDLMAAADQERILKLFEDFLNAQTGDLQIVVSTKTRTSPDLATAEQILARRRFLLVLSCSLPKADLATAKVQLTAAAETAIAGLARVGLSASLVGAERARQILADWWDPNQPLVVEERPKEVRIGGRWCRTLAVSSWPATANPGWLNSLINWSADLDISYHYRPVELALAQLKLNRKITELDSRQRQLQRKGRPEDPQTADALESALELRSDIQRGRQKLFLFGLTLTVWADSKPDLEQQTQKLQTLLASRLFGAKTALWQQAQALGSTLPRGSNDLGVWRNLNSACVALTFPFVGVDCADPGGILYGVSPANNSPVLVDRFSLANANSIIFAQSGAGKSYLAKVEILRSLPGGVEVVVIDPENEYQNLAESLGGQVIRFQAGGSVRLNLFDRQLWADGEGLIQTGTLVDLLDILIGLESSDERLLLDQLLGQLYAKLDQPLWADLVALAQSQAPNLVLRLKHFQASSLGQVLGRPTNINLTKPLTVLALDDWPAQSRAALILLFSAWVRGLAQKTPQKRLLIIDEGWLVLENSLAAQILAGLVRRARKYYLGVCFISQTADDFLNNPAGRVIASQSALKILLRADPTAIKTLARQFRLSAVEQDFLLTAGRGQALLLAESRHATVAVVASKFEHPLITTDPAEVLAGTAVHNNAGSEGLGFGS